MKYYIDELKIIGVRNATLYISGWVHSKNYEVLFYSNDSRIKKISGSIKRPDVVSFFNEKNDNILYGFFANITLNRNDKKIKIVIKIGGNIIDKIYIENSVYKNICNTISYKLKLINNKILMIFRGTGKAIKYASKNHQIFKHPQLLKLLFNKAKYKLFNKTMDAENTYQYNKWIRRYEKFFHKKNGYATKPLISIVMPVYNPKKEYLDECIKSVLNQTYSNFELCIADDCSTQKYVKRILDEYQRIDDRIKIVYCSKNGNISKATNAAIKIAKGEFIALLDDDDTLSKYALEEFVKILNIDKDIDFLYSDEDKLDFSGKRCKPHFKPDWSPDTLLSINYITHLCLIRSSLIEKVGGFRPKYDGAQDFDLFLRVTELTNKVYHISKILYHWRMSETSTAYNMESKNYAVSAGKMAIDDALRRRKISGEAKIYQGASYIVKYDIKKEPLVTIIIPIRDKALLLDKCLKSIYKKSIYKNYEILIVDNNSVESATFSLLERYKKDYKNFNSTRVEGEFNYSKINNIAAKVSGGEYLLFLNNDTKIISEDWINNLVGYASQPKIGAVGAKLLYPTDVVQHDGVILGLGEFEVAGHGYISAPRDFPGIAMRLVVPYNYSAVTAACMMVSRKKFEEVKGFEEELTVGYNDVDFNIKILNKGYYNLVLSHVELYHYESLSRQYDNTIEKQLRAIKEANYMKQKWGNFLQNDPFYNINYSLDYSFMLNLKPRK